MSLLQFILLVYFTFVIVDSGVVLYLHNKYGYIYYYKNSFIRQLMYLVGLSIAIYMANMNRYLEAFPNLTLMLAIIQFFLYFQIEFSGIGNTKKQVIYTILAASILVITNFIVLDTTLLVIINLVSSILILIYLNHYSFLNIESRVIFSMLWLMMGLNVYILQNYPEEFVPYWSIVAITLYLTQSFITTLHRKGKHDYLRYASNSKQLSIDELRERIVDISPVAMVLTDYHGMILYVNSAVTRMTGYEATELVGQHTRIFQSGETPKEQYQEMWQRIKSGNQWRSIIKNRKKNGSIYWEDVTIVPIINGDNVITNYLGIKIDSSEAVLERNSLEMNANYDDLTKTLRRHRFFELSYSKMQVRKDQPFHVVMIDVDNFKRVNDTLGHNVGDEILVAISYKIREIIPRTNSYLSRFGGDEFVLFTYGMRKKDLMLAIERLKESIIELSEQRLPDSIQISASVGLSRVKGSLDLAIKEADALMYRNKNH